MSLLSKVYKKVSAQTGLPTKTLKKILLDFYEIANKLGKQANEKNKTFCFELPHIGKIYNKVLQQIVIKQYQNENKKITSDVHDSDNDDE